MALQVGDKAIWRPWSRSDEKHPWYGHTVTIRQTPSSQYAPLYQFSVDDAPRVNNPKAFWFWDDEKRSNTSSSTLIERGQPRF